MQGPSKRDHWTFQAPGLGLAWVLVVGGAVGGCVDSQTFQMGPDVPTYAQYPTTRGSSSVATQPSEKGGESTEAPRRQTTTSVEPVEPSGVSSRPEEPSSEALPTESPSSSSVDPQDSSSEVLPEPDPEPEPEPEPDTRPRNGIKVLGDACDVDQECRSGSCRSISLEVMGFEIHTKTCAECSDHESCLSNGSGIACMPRVLDFANRNRSYYACSQGERGNLCQRDGHCGGDSICAQLIHGLPMLPEIPINTCGECRSDRDCQDPNRPLCQINVPVRDFRLPAHNTCVSR